MDEATGGGMGAEEWDERYREGRLWSLEPNAWVAETLADVPPGDAVDLGAGEGRNALWLASRGWRVTAVDFAAAGLALGRNRAADAGLEVEWVAADVTAWRPDRTDRAVDLVLLCFLQLE